MQKAFQIRSLNHLSSLGGCEPEAQGVKKSKAKPALCKPSSEKCYFRQVSLLHVGSEWEVKDSFI